MTDIDSVLDSLSSKNSRLQSEHAQTLVRIEVNKQKYFDSISRLKELGYDSVEDAEVEIENLTKNIQRSLEEIADLLQ